MEVPAVGEGVEGAIVYTTTPAIIRHVVRHNIHHEIHASLLQLRTQRLQIISSPKVRVQGIDVLRPVTMIRRPGGGIVTIDVLDDGGDPDGCEAHTLDVVKLGDETEVGATTVILVARVAGGGGREVGAGKAVG